MPVRTLALSVVAALVLSTFVTGVSPALSAYPGENGDIAFVTTRDGIEQIYVMAPNGAGQRNVSGNLDVRDILPVWSPDGSKMLISRKLTRTSWDIYALDPADGSAVQLTSDRAPDLRASWSPDASRFAFASRRGGDDAEILVADTSGVEANVVQLTENTVTDAQPAWSPVADRIAFTSQRDGNTEIYLMDPDGQNLQRLTDHSAADRHPAWSPDGTKIVFESNRNKTTTKVDLFVIDLGTGDVTQLTDRPGKETDPAWSPDGRWIAFRSGGRTKSEIFVLQLETGRVQRLTENEFLDFRPDWQPLVPPS